MKTLFIVFALAAFIGCAPAITTIPPKVDIEAPEHLLPTDSLEKAQAAVILVVGKLGLTVANSNVVGIKLLRNLSYERVYLSFEDSVRYADCGMREQHVPAIGHQIIMRKQIPAEYLDFTSSVIKRKSGIYLMVTTAYYAVGSKCGSRGVYEQDFIKLVEAELQTL